VAAVPSSKFVLATSAVVAPVPPLDIGIIPVIVVAVG